MNSLNDYWKLVGVKFRRLLRRASVDERGGILTLWALLITPAAIMLAVLSFEVMRERSAEEALQNNADDLVELLAVGRDNYEALELAGIHDTEGNIAGALPLEGECKLYPFKGCPKLRSIINSNLRANGIFAATLTFCYSMPSTTTSVASSPPPPPPEPPSAFVSLSALWYQEPNSVFIWPDGVRLLAVSDIALIADRHAPLNATFQPYNASTDRLDGSKPEGRNICSPTTTSSSVP